LYHLQNPLTALLATIRVTRHYRRTIQEHEHVIDRLHADALRHWHTTQALQFLARVNKTAVE